jgi:hypothetical protein
MHSRAEQVIFAAKTGRGFIRTGNFQVITGSVKTPTAKSAPQPLLTTGLLPIQISDIKKAPSRDSLRISPL